MRYSLQISKKSNSFVGTASSQPQTQQIQQTITTQPIVPKGAWDTAVISQIYHSQPISIDKIIKLPATQLIIVDTCTDVEFVRIHILRCIRHIFVMNCALSDLNSIQNLQSLSTLNLSGTDVDLASLSSLQQSRITFLTISTTDSFLQQCTFNNLFHPNEPHFYDDFLQLIQLPQQHFCKCKYLYDNSKQSEALCVSKLHIRLLLIQLLPKVRLINGKIVSDRERYASEMYFKLSERAKISPEIQILVEQGQKISRTRSNFDQIVKETVEFIQILTKNCTEKCECCQKFDCAEYLLRIGFPKVQCQLFDEPFGSVSQSQGKKTQKIPSFSSLLLHIFYLIDIYTYFAIDDVEKQINIAANGGQASNFYRYFLNSAQLTPYAIAEILSLNYVLTDQKPISPHLLVSLGMAILKCDNIRYYVQSRIPLADFDESELKDGSFQKKQKSIQYVYEKIQEQLEILFPFVRLASDVQPLDIVKIEPLNLSKEVEIYFWKNQQLTLQCCKHLHRSIQSKLKMLSERINCSQNAALGCNVDVFGTFYADEK